jgi:hypothetical protein
MKIVTQCLPAVFLCSVLAVLAAPQCSAQVRGTVEVSPIMGVYLPSGQLPPEPSACRCIKGAPCSCDPTPQPREQHSAIALGGRMTGWVNQRIAVEGSLWYSPSPITGPTTGGPAAIMTGNVRVLVRTGGAGTWAYLVGGPTFVGRFGDAYGAGTGTGRFGGVVGVGAHLRVARALAVRAEVEDYLYSVQRYHQQGFSLSLGLSVASRIGRATTP